MGSAEVGLSGSLQLKSWPVRDNKYWDSYDKSSIKYIYIYFPEEKKKKEILNTAIHHWEKQFWNFLLKYKRVWITMLKWNVSNFYTYEFLGFFFNTFAFSISYPGFWKRTMLINWNFSLDVCILPVFMFKQ